MLFCLALCAASPASAAILLVTSPADTGNNTLRAAVAASNTTTGLDLIAFAQGTSITVHTPLLISDPVVVEGGGTTVGSTGDAGASELFILQSGSAGSLIRRLALVSGVTGVRIDSDGNSLLGCVLGTDWSGATGRGNTRGAAVDGDGNRLGGILAGERNVFSGNHAAGLEITGSSNLVLGNFMGLNPAGTAALPNENGVVTGLGSSNWIGNGTAAGRNVIAGNRREGFTLDGSRQQVLGNYFGFNAAGTAVVANGNNASLFIYGASNWLTANQLANRMFFFGNGSTGNTAVANRFGILPAGGFSGSCLQGVFLGGDAAGNWIGLPGGQGNLIANTTDSGIYADGGTVVRNGFFGNTLVACGNLPIRLLNNANGSHSAPTVQAAVAGGQISGTAAPNDYVEVFVAEGNGSQDGTVRYVGADLATSGAWSMPAAGVPAGVYVCAVGTDAQNNSSVLSGKALVVTPTPTPTPTLSPTPTISPTRTQSPTQTLTPTVTVTSTPPGLPAGLAVLLLTYPNPGRETVRFVLEMGSEADVRVSLYNLGGERVADIAQRMPAGRDQAVAWDCRNAAPGLYLARIRVNGKEIATAKVAVIR
jgi:hypothetical protein